MSSKSKTFTRRDLLRLSGVSAAMSGVAAANYNFRKYQQPRTRVGIYKVTGYDRPLDKTIREGLLNYPDIVRRAQSGPVVLKPNLVEYNRSRPINTNPAVVAATIAAFKSIGAKHVIVAEGPGHCRDTELLVQESDLDHAVRSESAEFIDLNLDPVRAVTLPANHTKLKEIRFGETLLGASLIVSMPKLKTHHWAGVTLSLKNMFGTVPGAQYGWPKNILHWHGIENSIVDINTALKPHFAIVDGIEGMEGDGPLRGDRVSSQVIIMGENLTAVDATGARVMGFHPESITHLRMMLAHGGTVNADRIEQIGESIASVAKQFQVMPAHAILLQPLPLYSVWHGV